MTETKNTAAVPADATPARRKRAPKLTAAIAKETGRRIEAALAKPAPVPPSAIEVFERLARDPSVDVAKLERLIELQKSILAVEAKSAFDAAYAQMQAALPSIGKRGRIKNRAGAVQSRYALLEDIQSSVKPILTRFGFSLRHRTEWPVINVIRVVGILSHSQGHAEISTFEAPMDRSDFRSEVQSMGSTVSYGRRYTTVDLLNLVQHGIDDDGRGRQEPPKVAPAGHAIYISDDARARLWRAARKANRAETEIMMWLKVRFGIEDTAHVKAQDYAAIMEAIEAPGPLPLPEELPAV